MLLVGAGAFFQVSRSQCEPDSPPQDLMELPMNMAGYMSVARASTECEGQVGGAASYSLLQSRGRSVVWKHVTLGRRLKAPKIFSEGKPEADRPKVCLRKNRLCLVLFFNVLGCDSSRRDHRRGEQAL